MNSFPSKPLPQPPPSLLQWKVRRTLAFSIHELALILGDQLTAADLVPIFNSFLKDLDEVRIGVLKHLYDFLKVRTALCLFLCKGSLVIPVLKGHVCFRSHILKTPLTCVCSKTMLGILDLGVFFPSFRKCYLREGGGGDSSFLAWPFVPYFWGSQHYFALA